MSAVGLPVASGLLVPLPRGNNPHSYQHLATACWYVHAALHLP